MAVPHGDRLAGYRKLDRPAKTFSCIGRQLAHRSPPSRSLRLVTSLRLRGASLGGAHICRSLRSGLDRRKRAEAQPLMHRLLESSLAFQPQLAAGTRLPKREISHPYLRKPFELRKYGEVDVVARIFEAQIDLTVFDHQPPAFHSSLRVRKIKVD